VRSFGPPERRARLAVRHRLTAKERAATPVQVAQSLVALHSTDPASVYLACMARSQDGDAASLERALYDERSIVRILGMRRTMFVVPVELTGVVHAACTRAVAVQQRKRVVQLLEHAGVAADGAAWLTRVESATMAAVRERGEALGGELTQAVPDLRTQIAFGEGKKWAGVQGVTTMVLFLLAADGKLVRGRPRGSWISSQYRWTTLAGWLGSDLVEWTVEEARVELARCWLAAFGPALAADLQWWTGWTGAETRRALGPLRPAVVDLAGTPGLVLPDDVDPTAAPEPWAALLPALDPTVMGWSERSWYLGDHRAALFDRSGNAGPTVWWDGRIVGGWAQRKSGDIALRLLCDVGADGAVAVDEAADRLTHAIGDVRVTPRFRTPLERELSA
jgi:hypothetical protein